MTPIKSSLPIKHAARLTPILKNCWVHLRRKCRTFLGASKEIQSLLEDVFSTRKPQTCEAVLGTAETGMWGRLFFRSVRLDKKRLVLLIVEDLTLEKKELLLSQKYQADLEKQVAERKKAEKALEKANRNWRIGFDNAPVTCGTK